MSKKNKTVLGRGLGALISNASFSTPEERERLPVDDGISVDTICRVDLTRVRPNPYQPRIDFDPVALQELKLSIIQNGVIQPITVRRKDGAFELISGERRVRASIDAGLKDIPAYILPIESEREMMELALIENVQRENLNPIEIALGYQRLIAECDLTQEEVAQKVGKDRSTVTNFIRLLKLPDAIQSSLRGNEISMGHARALLTAPDDEHRLDLWERVRDEGLSVRRTESLVKEYAKSVAKKGSEPRPGTNGSTPKPEPTVSREFDAMLVEITTRLQQVLGTQVKIRASGAGEGAIQIDFYSSEDLERLLELFAIIERQHS